MRRRIVISGELHQLKHGQHCLSWSSGSKACHLTTTASGHDNFRKLLAAQVPCCLCSLAVHWHRLIASQESANAFLAAAVLSSPKLISYSKSICTI